MPFCSNCGKEVSEGVKFCPECGEGLKEGFTSDKRRDKGGTNSGRYQYPYGVVPPWEGEDNRHHSLLEEPKVVDTKTIVCRKVRDEVYRALLLVREDGTTELKCKGGCSDCPYNL